MLSNEIILFVFLSYLTVFFAEANLSPAPNCPQELHGINDFKMSELWRDKGECVGLEEIARNMLIYIKTCGVFDIKPRLYIAYTRAEFSPKNQNIIDFFEFDPLYKRYFLKSSVTKNEVYNEIYSLAAVKLSAKCTT